MKLNLSSLYVMKFFFVVDAVLLHLFVTSHHLTTLCTE